MGNKHNANNRACDLYAKKLDEILSLGAQQTNYSFGLEERVPVTTDGQGSWTVNRSDKTDVKIKPKRSNLRLCLVDIRLKISGTAQIRLERGTGTKTKKINYKSKKVWPFDRSLHKFFVFFTACLLIICFTYYYIIFIFKRVEQHRLWFFFFFKNK
jgi:hypothetical protein